ncbi:acylneuraminate cytidylyltransferase family protein [Candidatus Woesearchaeota archaeon]|nr:acylneuraminate cytidylyltransferase family protein [Candidatus Woesearchaeota archaeon]
MIIAIIPARGGSKGIPRKNLIPFCGKPLVAWSVEAAKGAKHVDEVYVSTDDDEIAGICEKHGAKIVKRPAEISGDEASSESALIHVFDSLGADVRKKIELIVFLQATSPIREASDIDKAVEYLKAEKADSLFSAFYIGDFYVWKIKEGKPVSINYDYRRRERRQDFEKQYRENGSIYVFKPGILTKQKNRLGGKILLFEMDPWKSQQIDEPRDIPLLEFYMKALQEGKIPDM